MNSSQANPSRQENGFVSILVNIVIPVLILNKLSERWSPLGALLLALSLPLAYGVWSLTRQKKVNPFSALGVLNISVTGTLALLGIGGIWFAIKEAFFPLLIGIFVWVSSHSKKPFIETLLFQPHVMHLDRLEEKLTLGNARQIFLKHLQLCTRFLAVSFFLSSFLNFAIATYIFEPLAPDLDATAKSVMLNEQIAKMTAWSFPAILGPSLILLVGITWYLFRGLKIITGLKPQDLLKS